MKIIIFFLALTIHAAHAATGGFSGGGGNLINPTPPKSYQDPREIRMIILGSRHLLARYLDGKLALYRTGSMSFDDARMYSVFFANNERTCETIEEIHLDTPLDRSCFDEKGVQYDGSTVDRRADAVCISAYAIANKSDRFEVPIQAAALILHEIGEVLGLSDDDAIKLQSQVIQELKMY